MNELFATRRNISHGLVGDKIETVIEMVLVASEPTTQFAGSSVVRVDTLSTHRFLMTVDGATILRSDLTKWIEEAKKQHAKLTIKKDQS